MLTGEIRSQIDRIWNAFWSGRHLQPARSHRADHLPALPQAARRPADAGGEQGRRASRSRWSAASSPRARTRRGRPYEDFRWSRFKNLAPAEMFTVVGRARLSVPPHARRRRLHLRASHEGRALHHPDAGAARQGGGHARPGADGGPRHQGRPLRIHARQDRHRRAERPVPHAAPHHPADGRDDGADADGRHLRSRLRHLRLPRRGRANICASGIRKSCATTKLREHFHHRPVPRLRLRQHHAPHRQHEHAAARRRKSRTSATAIRSRRTTPARRRNTRSCSPIRPSPARSTTRTAPRTSCRSSRPRRPSCSSSRSSCACSSPAAAPPSSCRTACSSAPATRTRQLRRMLVEDQKLDAVISLPGGVFKPYAGVSTAILLFTKTNSGGTDQVWFYDVEADGWSLDDKRAPLLARRQARPRTARGAHRGRAQQEQPARRAARAGNGAAMPSANARAPRRASACRRPTSLPQGYDLSA